MKSNELFLFNSWKVGFAFQLGKFSLEGFLGCTPDETVDILMHPSAQNKHQAASLHLTLFVATWLNST